jgi:hypothetical protein
VGDVERCAAGQEGERARGARGVFGGGGVGAGEVEALDLVEGPSDVGLGEPGFELIEGKAGLGHEPQEGGARVEEEGEDCLIGEARWEGRGFGGRGWPVAGQLAEQARGALESGRIDRCDDGHVSPLRLEMNQPTRGGSRGPRMTPMSWVGGSRRASFWTILGICGSSRSA